MILLYIVAAYVAYVIFLIRLVSLIDIKYIKYCNLVGKNIDKEELAYNGGKIDDKYDEMNIGLSVFTWFPGVNVICLGFVFIFYLVYLIERISVGVSSGCENIRVYIFNKKIQVRLDFIIKWFKKLYKFFVFDTK